ncbi:MAG: hypothetical protein IPJ49_27260 [Candidatus Obscuribacter sp.]|nr:hypothetical protein [Candidatus Obscuribacter sp.]
MSLSQEPAYSYIRRRYVCGYRNIMSEPYAGNSGVHPINGMAVSTTNGAGPHNLQLFALAQDGTVLTCLPGFWDPNDLVSELELAERLNAVHTDKYITADKKAEIFKSMHLEHERQHSSETIARSQLQGFDRLNIYKHGAMLSDCVADPTLLKDADPHHLNAAAFKTTDRIYHDRMSKHPFEPYQSFDVVGYTNYGTNHYDRGENDHDPATKLATKNKDLRHLTQATETVAFVSTPKAATGANRDITKMYADLTKAQSLDGKSKPEQFAILSSQKKWRQAYAVATQIIQESPTKPDGYEMRAAASLALSYPAQAQNDAARALWLGSRKPSVIRVKHQAEQALKAKKGHLAYTDR